MKIWEVKILSNILDKFSYKLDGENEWIAHQELQCWSRFTIKTDKNEEVHKPAEIVHEHHEPAKTEKTEEVHKPVETPKETETHLEKKDIKSKIPALRNVLDD